MAAQALYRKWRSQTFEDVIGQQHVTETLKNAIATNRVAHAYLFAGPRGTGKTSTARILAKAVNCVGPEPKPCNQCGICNAVSDGRLMDLIEIDAASNTSVDDIRDLRDKVGFRPGEAKMKFYIIDEVHMLSKSAFNALLKTLEEPPPHVIFVLATTEPEKIPATILSRCQRFDFRRIKVVDIVGRLQFIVEQEGLQAEETALTFIARQAGGSMRDAISLLDQLTAYGQEAITLALVHSVLGTANTTATKTLVDFLLTQDVAGGLKVINDAVGNGIEPRQFTLEILEYLRGLLLIKYGEGQQFLGLPPEMIETMQVQARAVEAKELLYATQCFNNAIKEFKISAGNVTIPQLPLELALVEAVVGSAKPAAAVAPIALPQATARPGPVAAKPVDAPTAMAQPGSAPTSPPAAVAQQTLSSTGLTKESLRQQWGRILGEVKQRGGNQEYLKKPMVQGLEIDGNTIVILFAPPYDMAAERANKSKTVILDAFQKVLGKSWQVEFKVMSSDPTAPTPVSSANEPDNLQDDELIKTALELGGQIKHTS